jgi:hypothetical protein
VFRSKLRGIKSNGIQPQTKSKDAAGWSVTAGSECQFEYINKQSGEFIPERPPVIAVNTKKKEVIGNSKHTGVEYHQKKKATKVWEHDVPIQELWNRTLTGTRDR